MADSYISGAEPDKKLQTYENNVGGNDVHSEAVTLTGTDGVPYTPENPYPVGMPQSLDAGNSATRTAADGASEFVGAWTATRSVGVVRQLVVLASTVTSGLGGTFVFEYSEDGATATISESRPIGDFATVRDFDLLNAGAYFRVRFTPSRALVGGEMVFITTTLRRQNDGAFVRLANQEIEEQNAALPSEFAYLKAFEPITGKSINIRPTAAGALRTDVEGATYTQSGSLFTEGVRDDIDLIFSRDQGAANIAHLVDCSSVNGTVTHDATEGQAVFAVPATNGSICYFESDKRAVYEPGHQIRGGMTIELSALPTGDAKVEWGWGECTGNALTNGIGFGIDATDFYTFRIKNGVYVSKVYQPDFNRDRLDGSAGSRYIANGAPVELDHLNNGIFECGFEWYGVAPPSFYTTSPGGLPILCHVEETTGRQMGTTIPEPQVPMFIRIANGTSGQALEVRTGSWRGGIFTNKLVAMGRQPDRDYAAAKADGVVFTTSTPLGAAGVYLSPPFDTDGWRSIEIYIATDQVSAGNGIELEYTPDLSAAVPLWYPGIKRTFGAADVANGFLVIRTAVVMDGFRLRYTNGGIPQGSFLLECAARVENVELPQATIGSGITRTSNAVMTRGAIEADNGTEYGQIQRGTNGGLDIGVVQHEVPTPIKSDTALNMSTGTVPTSGAKIIDFTAVPAGATAVTIQADSANGNAVIYLATSQAGSVGGASAGFVLGSSQSFTMSIGTGLTHDVWGASSTGSARWRMTWTIGGGV